MIGFDPYDPHSLPPPVAPPPVRRNFNENVHVDTAPQTYASQMMGGARYNTGEPPAPITCLKCKRSHVDGTPVDVLKTEEAYDRDVTTANGRAKKACLPPCPSPALAALVPFVYHMKPCGCVVTEADMLTAQQRVDAIPRILAAVGQMLSQRVVGANSVTYDYWLVVAADRIANLSYGDQRLTLSTPLALSPEVVDWAARRNLTLPDIPGQATQPGTTAFGYRPQQALPQQASRRRQEANPAVAAESLGATPPPGARPPKNVPPVAQLRKGFDVKDLNRRRRKIIIDIATE